VSAGMTADAENHSAMAATWQVAMIVIDAAFDAAHLVMTATGVRSSAT
jgi:hypothetical protein